MKIRLAFLVAFVVGAAGMRLAAHHSFAAQYDPTKAIRITGTLSKVEWGNPHTYFYLDVKEPDGTVVTWGCEGAAPAHGQSGSSPPSDPQRIPGRWPRRKIPSPICSNGWLMSWRWTRRMIVAAF